MFASLKRRGQTASTQPPAWQLDEQLLADPRNASLVEAGRRKAELEGQRIRDEISAAISNRKRFLTLTWGADHDWYVGEVTDAANEKSKNVLFLQFHSFFKNSATGGSGKATLTLVEAK